MTLQQFRIWTSLSRGLCGAVRDTDMRKDGLQVQGTACWERTAVLVTRADEWGRAWPALGDHVGSDVHRLIVGALQ